MRKQSLFTLLALLFLALAVPCTAFAEDSASASKSASAKEAHFGGLRLTADLMLGAGRCDDHKMCLGDNERDGKNHEFAILVQLHAGYLWGSSVFIGPEITVLGGSPMYIGGDLRARLVIPVTDSDAVNLAVGFGFAYHNKYENTDFNEGSNGINYLYIPIQFGYEHVFDSGLVLGGSLQVNLATHRKESYNPYDGSEQYDNLAVMGFLGGGVTLGYKF